MKHIKLFQKFLLISITALNFNAHAEFLSQETYKLNYIHENYNGEYSEEEVMSAITSGLNYWNDCTNKTVSITNEDIPFKIKWTSELKDSETGDTVYYKKGDEIISFNIRINQNKKLTLKDIKLIAAHEFGHILQVEHNLDKDSVMNYKASSVLNNTINQAKDISYCKHKPLF